MAAEKPIQAHFEILACLEFPVGLEIGVWAKSMFDWSSIGASCTLASVNPRSYDKTTAPRHLCPGAAV